MQRSWYQWIGLLVFCTVCSTELPAQQAKDAGRLLYWTPGRQLRFNDFQVRKRSGDTIYIRRNGQPDVHRLGAISTAIDVHVKRERGRTTFTVRAVMDPQASWIGADGDSVILRHEQGHFDIAEIYTRVMRRELRKARSHQHSKEIYEAVLAEESALHASFDQANPYEAGGITREWKQRIDQRLKALAGFSNPVVVLAFDR